MNGDQADRLRADGLDVVTARIPPMPAGPPCAAVWMSHVLEHAKDPAEALAMVRSAVERLSPGGLLVAIGPEFGAWKDNFYSVDWSHGYPTDVRRVGQLLQEAGLEILEARTHVFGTAAPGLVPLLAMLLRLLPVRAIDAVLRAFGQRDLAFAFMTVAGWQQLLVIGRRPA